MLHPRQPGTRPTDRTPIADERVQPSGRSRGRRRAAAVLAGLLAAATTLVGGVVVGRQVAGNAAAAGVPKGSPYGVAEHMWFRPGGMWFSGWTVDPSAPTQAGIAYVLVDGKMAGQAVANLARPDVAKAHPSAGPNHGFAFQVLIPEGAHRVCVKAHNVGAGVNVVLRCQNRTLDYGPFGAVQKVSAAHGQITVSGWSVDYDNRTAPLTVQLTLDGQTSKLVADRPNAAADAGAHLAGPNHGFRFTVPVNQGPHTACVRVTNLGYGTDTAFPCSTVTLNDSPHIGLNSTGQDTGKLRSVGWAFDPDAPTTPATVLIKIDDKTHTVVASGSRPDVARVFPGVGAAHGFDVSYTVAEGTHQVCISARNVAFGSDTALACRTVTLNFTPTASTTALTATSTGLHVAGWATDPDTTKPIAVRITLDGKALPTLTANAKGTTNSGHEFQLDVPTRSGRHTVCAVGINALYGTHDSVPSCRKITLTLSPLGHFDSVSRASGSNDLSVVGWAFDPDTASALGVQVSIDGQAATTVKTGVLRTDVQARYPSAGKNRGFTTVLPTDAGEHTVCVVAPNVGGGQDHDLGCKLINAVNPVVPSAPQQVTAQGGYGGAMVSWTPPASDGGAPWTSYVITATPGGVHTTVAASMTSATIAGLKPSTAYSFTVQAVNVAGTSPAGTSPTVTTQAGPPPQTSPAPVSTSRYIRNIRGASAAELAVMKNEGATDAYYNPSGHGYLILLDIGGQDEYDGGVVLSATTRFVSYANLVKDLQAYVDGYASKQKASAPVVIAIGTNNDMEVTAAAGRSWADKVVDPIAAYTKKHYAGITVSGANDIEPGFRAGYSATKAWLGGYLGATSAPFVFNGSADGCAWTTTNRGCNNGWSMSGLYYLAAGAAPLRMLNLPQIYNYTMADQWKYISLTGVVKSQPRINFAGTLTEWTACSQSGNSCGSITGHSAWSKMWSNLQSDSRLKVGSLPYSTDLRIDR